MHSILILGLLISCRTEKETATDSGALASVDADGDGFANDVDCDDTNPFVNPDMEETCDALDNDCDGASDQGFCGDGVLNRTEQCDGESWCGAYCSGSPPVRSKYYFL